MAAPTFYIETSVWGSLAPKQPADRKRFVKRLLARLDGVRGIALVSDTVLAEIKLAPPDKVIAILRGLDSVEPLVIPITADIQVLAEAYLSAGIIPARRQWDAVHVAAATCFQCNYLVSWNHRHMTRPSKRLQYETVNRAHGYLKSPLICNPVEAFHELGPG